MQVSTENSSIGDSEEIEESIAGSERARVSTEDSRRTRQELNTGQTSVNKAADASLDELPRSFSESSSSSPTPANLLTYGDINPFNPISFGE